MDYYFDPSISSGGAGTQASPWPMSLIPSTGAPGDRILIKAGTTYTGTLSYGRSGASGNPITFDWWGTAPTNPVFDGGGTTAGAVLSISGSYITLNNLIIQNGAHYNGLLYLGSGVKDITVNNCYLNKGIRGINAVYCGSAGVANIKILHSWIYNIADAPTHPVGGGSHIQFNNVSGSGCEIAYNNCWTDGTVTNLLGVGDIISIYQSNGTSGSYILVHDNNILGGSTNTSGYDGLGAGDVGGSYQNFYNNKMVDTGCAGIQLVGGTNIIINNNQIFGSGGSWCFQGITCGYFGGTPAGNWTCTNNKVNFINKYGNKNSWYVSSITGTPAVDMSTNTPQLSYDPTITAAILPNPLWTGTPWNIRGAGLVFPPIPAKTYGQADFDPGATSTNAITYSTSDISIATVVAGKIHIVKSGTCTITATDGNTTLTQNLTINKAVLTATADNKTKTYGYGIPSLTVTITGYVNGENSLVLTSQPMPATTGTTSSPVGTYPITVSGGSAGNYTFSYVSGTLTVVKAALTITADSKSKVYGAAMPSLTISYNGFQNGDTPASLITPATISTTGTGSSPAGSYPITVSGATASNYTITFVNGTLTITPAVLTVTANNQSKVVGAVNPALTYGITGYTNGDTSSVVTTQPTLTTTATTSSPVGNYPITGSGAVAGPNYTISYVNATLTVNPAGITFPPLPTKTYGDADFNPGASSSQPITYTSDNTAVAVIISGNIHVVAPGSCNIIASNGSTTASQPLTVNKKALIVTADNFVIFLGDPIPSPLTFSYNGFILGEGPGNLTSQPTVSTTATGSSPVGTYPTTPSGGTAANYSFTYVNGSLVITATGTIVIRYPIVTI